MQSHAFPCSCNRKWSGATSGWSVGLPDGWRALFSFSAASLVALASAVRAKAVHPSIFLLDRLVCSRHWEGNQSSPVQNPVTHEEFARDGNAMYVVSCYCLRTETAWLGRNIGTFFFFFPGQPEILLRKKYHVPWFAEVRLSDFSKAFTQHTPAALGLFIHFKEFCWQFSLYLVINYTM